MDIRYIIIYILIILYTSTESITGLSPIHLLPPAHLANAPAALQPQPQSPPELPFPWILLDLGNWGIPLKIRIGRMISKWGISLRNGSILMRNMRCFPICGWGVHYVQTNPYRTHRTIWNPTETTRCLEL